jgi:chromosomal replication initiator protein
MTDLASAIRRSKFVPRVSLTTAPVLLVQKEAATADPFVPPKYPRALDIKKAVADYYSISLIDIDSPRRRECVTRPRQIAIYLCCKLTALSYGELGRRFGGRDHTTIMHSVAVVTRRLLSDKKLKLEVDELEAKFDVPQT